MNSFFDTYKGLAGAAAEFAIQEGNDPSSFVVLLAGITSPLAVPALKRAITTARRRGALGATLSVEDAVELVTGDREPGPEADQVVATLRSPARAGNSWLIVINGDEAEIIQVSRRLGGFELVNAKGGVS
jgi:hypothetical protein